MEWTIAEAKKKLSQVIREVEKEPQWLCNRGRLERRPSIGEAFLKLRKLCSEEGYTFDIPTRSSDS